MPFIRPNIGDVVWCYPGSPDRPYPAIVTGLHEADPTEPNPIKRHHQARRLNLYVFDDAEEHAPGVHLGYRTRIDFSWVPKSCTWTFRFLSLEDALQEEQAEDLLRFP